MSLMFLLLKWFKDKRSILQICYIPHITNIVVRIINLHDEYFEFVMQNANSDRTLDTFLVLKSLVYHRSIIVMFA